MTRQIIFDTETTGLSFKDGHRVIEIGCVEMINRRLTQNNFQRYINPEREVEAEALKVHGITNDFLLDKPKFADIAEEFYNYVKGAEIIAHNAPFDIGFLDYELQLAQPSFQKLAVCCEIFDTLILARQLHPGQRNSLDALIKRYKIDNFNRDLHGALLDAEILAQIYLSMTGGQGSLFDDESSEKQSKENISHNIKKISYEALPVINATESEIASHESFLQLLDSQSEGQCVWRSKED